MAVEPELSLAELQDAFARWRQTRRPRQIPAALGAQAVALLGRHRTNEILRALGIDHRTLMRWKRQYGEGDAPPAPAFVALPAPALAAAAPAVAAVTEAETLALTLTRQGREGAVWSLAGTLTLEQWRAVLTLLAAEDIAR